MLQVPDSLESAKVIAHSTAESSADRIRLIVVDDDDDFREAATVELEDLGFTVTAYANGTQLLAALNQESDSIAADAIILDWNMPDMTGIELAPRLRQLGIRLPIVFLTGRSAPNFESAALDQGALDFVDKARGITILAKRIRLIVGTTLAAPAIVVEETLQFGRLQLKPRSSRAFWNGTDIGLTLTEFNVVRLLASNAGKHVSYRAVYDCMHHAGFIAGSGEHGYRTNVRSTIKRIRNKLKAIDNAFGEIENYPSFGYRWTVAEPTIA
jgi:two-component system, OmpR family, response regulator ChvI